MSLKCPKCSSEDVRPSISRGWERMLIVLWLRPFRCEACYHRFLGLRRRYQ